MKTVILAGGLGTRLSEETTLRPKPMVEIAGRPILWHIMKRYAMYGHCDFVICCGYRGYTIKEYFANYALHNSDVTIDLERGAISVHRSASEPWRVTLVDTGDGTMTGGRLKRVLPFLSSEEPFLMTYGDGVGDVDISGLIHFHESHRRAATITVVQPPGRFGRVRVEGDVVASFDEKPEEDGAWINAGFFVLEPRVLDLVDGDRTVWEAEPLRRMAAEGELVAFKHRGFWQPMDTLRDRNALEEIAAGGDAPWLKRV